MRKIRHRIFFIWFISNGLLLSLPIAGIVIAFSESSRVILREVEESHQASLNQIKHFIDGSLRETDRLALEIGWNPLLTGLMNRELPFVERDQYNFFQFHKIARIYLAVNRLLDDFYIYLPGTNAVLTSRSLYSDSREYVSFNYGPDLSHESWLDMMQLHYQGEVHFFTGLPQVDVESFSWLRTFPSGTAGTIQAQVVLNISGSYIETVLAENLWLSDVVVGIMTRDGRIVFSSSDKEAFNGFENLANAGVKLKRSFDGQPFMFTKEESDVAEWTYFSLIPESIFLNQAKSVQSKLILILIATYMAAFSILYYVTRRNYKPIRRMVRIFESDSRAQGDRDELAFIQRSVTELLDSQQTASRQNFINRLITGRLSGNVAIEEGCDRYELDFENKYFQVMLIYIEELEESGDQLFSRTHLDQLCKRMYETYDFHTLEIRGVPLCLYIFDQLENRSAIEQASVKLIDTIHSEYNIGVSLAFSSIKDDANLISIAYDESQEALEYELFRGGRTISFYEDLSGEVRPSAFSSSLELETRFLNAVRVNEFDAAKNILIAEIDRIVEGNASFVLMKSRVTGIINLIIDSIGELRGVLEGDYATQIQDLLDGGSAEQLKTLIVSLLSDMEREVTANQDSEREPLYRQVDDYLKANYTDINLTVGVIADYLSVSDSYLSTIYKKQTGSGLLQSIHKIRIRDARKLLRSCDDNLSAIAVRVGYINDIALIRAFKRYEGISPGKYRDSLKNRQS